MTQRGTCCDAGRFFPPPSFFPTVEPRLGDCPSRGPLGKTPLPPLVTGDDLYSSVYPFFSPGRLLFMSGLPVILSDVSTILFAIGALHTVSAFPSYLFLPFPFSRFSLVFACQILTFSLYPQCDSSSQPPPVLECIIRTMYRHVFCTSGPAPPVRCAQAHSFSLSSSFSFPRPARSLKALFPPLVRFTSTEGPHLPSCVIIVSDLFYTFS